MAASIEDQLNNIEAGSLTLNLPKHEALETLLTEGRQGAYSVSGRADISNPKDVVLSTSLQEGDCAYPDLVMHGPMTIRAGQNEQVAEVTSAIAFMNAKGEPAKLEEHDLIVDLHSGDHTIRFKSSAGDGTDPIEARGNKFGVSQNGESHTALIEEITDASGKKHTALEFTSVSPDSARSVTDTFVFKDGVTPDYLRSEAAPRADQVIGVIHSNAAIAGDKIDFQLEIQAARDITFPSLAAGH